MWHCFALREVSLMSGVTWILMKEFNLLPYLTSAHLRETSEKEMQCHGITPVILFTLQIPQEGTLRTPEMGRKVCDKRQTSPLRPRTAKTLYSCQVQRGIKLSGKDTVSPKPLPAHTTLRRRSLCAAGTWGKGQET